MDELQFIIPDLDTSAIREYLEQHVKHALDILSDPDTSITDENAKFELYRLNEAARELDMLEDIYSEWQRYRKWARDELISVLQDMEKFEKEPESAE